MEKKSKSDANMTDIRVKLNTVRKRIEGLDLKITKLNSAIAMDRQQLQQLESDRCAKNNEDLAAALDLEEEMERLRKEVEAVEAARFLALEKVREADGLLTEWEDKVR